jgi:hypothetical protein
MSWGAFLQPVRYGDGERDRLVDDLIDVVEMRGDKNGVGSFDTKVANSVFGTHDPVHRLPLVKTPRSKMNRNTASQSPSIWGGRTLMQRTAL